MPYLIRLPEVKQRIGLQKAAIYAHVKLGIITPSVKISTQASAWPLHEINAVVNARIAGKTDDEIRELVKELVAQRTAGEVAQ